MSNVLVELQQKIVDFRNRRDWKKFHTLKNLAESLVLEAAEVLELFQWKNDGEIDDYLKTNKETLSDELADVFNHLLLLAHETGIDLPTALKRKMEKNEKKYPEDKVRGSAKKYTEYSQD